MHYSRVNLIVNFEQVNAGWEMISHKMQESCFLNRSLLDYLLQQVRKLPNERQNWNIHMMP